MFELHSLIKKLQERRALFEYRYTEEDDLVKVKETLNKRLVVLREKLIEDPNNESVILEYGFCAEEVERITKRLEYFREKYATKEAKIQKYETLINYNIQELYSYVDFMEKFKIDDKLHDALLNTIESLDKNITILNQINKEEEKEDETEDQNTLSVK